MKTVHSDWVSCRHKLIYSGLLPFQSFCQQPSLPAVSALRGLRMSLKGKTHAFIVSDHEAPRCLSQSSKEKKNKYHIWIAGIVLLKNQELEDGSKRLPLNPLRLRKVGFLAFTTMQAECYLSLNDIICSSSLRTATAVLRGACLCVLQVHGY